MFNAVIKNRLIYNSCWEDPRIDRALLNLNTDSTVVMLTSAGCNALDYLMDEPASIHCVDTNPAQNALLELKLALFRNGNYAALWNMLGNGQYYGASTLYHKKLRPQICEQAQEFWDHHVNYFLPSAAAPSFYFNGTSGTVALLIYNQIKRKGLNHSVIKLLESQSLEEQQHYFEDIEPHLWNTFSRWLLRRNATMSLLGVPSVQRAMIDKEVNGGLLSFIRRSLCNVFTRRLLADNYFWRVYLTGSYTRDCCPEYLKEKNFESIHEAINCIRQTTGTLAYFLVQNPGRYSHFVLLDQLDWLAHHQPEEMKQEWTLILENAVPGAKILFRSAAASRSFLPEFVNTHVKFDDAKTKRLHATDRVGTYGSTHLATVHTPL